MQNENINFPPLYKELFLSDDVFEAQRQQMAMSNLPSESTDHISANSNTNNTLHPKTQYENYIKSDFPLDSNGRMGLDRFEIKRVSSNNNERNISRSSVLTSDSGCALSLADVDESSTSNGGFLNSETRNRMSSTHSTDTYSPLLSDNGVIESSPPLPVSDYNMDGYYRRISITGDSGCDGDSPRHQSTEMTHGPLQTNTKITSCKAENSEEYNENYKIANKAQYPFQIPSIPPASSTAATDHQYCPPNYPLRPPLNPTENTQSMQYGAKVRNIYSAYQ